MMKSTLRTAALAALALVITAVAIPETVEAQYFGRTNVQYRTFDFQVLETEHFDVYYYPESEEAAHDVARMAERWYARLSRILNHEFRERQPLILYANHPDFQQTTITPGGVGEGVQGFAEVFKQRIAMPILGSYQDTDHLVGHELVHAFQYDISGMGRAGPALIEVAQRFQAPLWFMEGQAEYLSNGPVHPHTAMWLRDAAVQGELPTIRQMTRNPQRYFPYRWGQALWSYVGGRWGDAVIGQILRQVGQGASVEEAFQRILNISVGQLSEEWHTEIRRAYLPLVAEMEQPHEVGQALFAFREGEDMAGRINVGPAISPDGRFMVFMSELDALDISLYLADARTGEVIRRLQRGTTFDPHFGSIRFIASAGSWAPDSRQFVFSALRQGSDRLVILDTERGRRTREIVMPGLFEISNPTWSPDGRTIAFTAIVGGLSNLYTVDIETQEVTQLTNDRYTYLHPEFSPDGASLAFATDRHPGTDLGTLDIGNYRIGVMDLATQELTILPQMELGKNINPSWGPGGESIYFVSNRNGVPNIYRIAVADGALFQLTNLYTGASGFTDVSPSLGVASGANRLVFSAYQNGGYAIYAIDDTERLAGRPVTASVAETETADEALGTIEIDGEVITPATAGMLPPIPRPTEPAFNRVQAAITDPATGLPTAGQVAGWEVVPYRPRLSLDFLGQPTIGVGVGGFGGTQLAGGIFGAFSDMLGRHHVSATLQAQGMLDEIGFSTQYLYMRDRWNYGAAAQRIPIIYPFYDQEIVRDADGRPFLADQLVRGRIFDSRIQGIAQYPFSRLQRAEFSLGLRRFARSDRIFEVLYPIVDGQIGPPVDQRERTREDFSLNFAEASGALIYDSSVFGFTSPIAGQRYRFEVSPMFGQLQAASGLADYRRYFFLRPFTLAFRGYHMGFYGRDAEGVEREVEAVDPNTGEVVTQTGRVRILPELYAGFPFWMRGYSPASLDQDCRQEGGSIDSPSCRLLLQSTGTRVGIFNAELRFPLIQRLELGVIGGGFPPIEGFLFGDAGVAWREGGAPTFQTVDLTAEPVRDELGRFVAPDERGFLRSYGAGARVNVFGYFVVEVAYANAMDRPRGAHWHIAIQPGF